MIQSYLKLQNNSQMRSRHSCWHLRHASEIIKQQKKWLYHLPYCDPATPRLNLMQQKTAQACQTLNLSVKLTLIFKKWGGQYLLLQNTPSRYFVKPRRLKFQSHPAKIYLFEVYKFIPFCKRFSPSSTLSHCVAIFIRRKNLSPL